MRGSQKGITLLGAIVLALVVGGWILVGIRVTPVYLNYMKVSGTLEKVREEFEADPAGGEVAIRKAIERHFDIESVDTPVPEDILIKKEAGHFLVTAAYEDVAPLLANVSVLIEFDRSVEVPSN
jgi:hypothetical protein